MSDTSLSRSPGQTTRSVSRVLEEALVEGRVQNPNGEYREVVANISLANSRALNKLVRDRRPQLVIEIGMGLGVSALTILDALESNGSGRLISIDPYIDWPTGPLVALHQIARAGVADRHTHLHECSYTALPRLLADKVRPDFVYIDGNHNFDYAFTDLFFADKLLGEGGIVGFNDAGWRSVFKVISFLQKYRRYREIDVGLPKVYRARNMLFSLIKRFEGRSTYDRYFEKLEAWEPPHGFYKGI